MARQKSEGRGDGERRQGRLIGGRDFQRSSSVITRPGALSLSGKQGSGGKDPTALREPALLFPKVQDTNAPKQRYHQVAQVFSHSLKPVEVVMFWRIGDKAKESSMGLFTYSCHEGSASQ